MLLIIFFLASCEAKTMFARVGDDVQLSCDSNKSIVWMKREFFNESRVSIIPHNDSSFVLKSVRFEDTGIYECSSNESNSTTKIELIVGDGLKQCRENFGKPCPINCKIETAINHLGFLVCFDAVSKFLFAMGTFPTIRNSSRYVTHMSVNFSKSASCDLRLYRSEKIIYVERFLEFVLRPEKPVEQFQLLNYLIPVVVVIVLIMMAIIIEIAIRKSNILKKIKHFQSRRKSQNALLSPS